MAIKPMIIKPKAIRSKQNSCAQGVFQTKRDEAA